MSNPNGRNWFLLTPLASDVNSLILDKGQTPVVHTFTDIQAAGLYIECTDFAPGSSPYVTIKSFTANALVDDPPAGTTILLR